MRITGAAAGVLVLLALAGCASTSSQLSDAAGEAASATSSAALAVHLHDSGATVAVVATSLGDSLRELQSAQQSVTALAPTPAESAARARALAAIRQAEDAVLAQQQALDGGASLDSGDLTAAAKRLTSLEDAG